MGELGELIQAHIDRQKYPVSRSQIARAVGVSRQGLGNWVTGDAMPDPGNLRKLAAVIETPYTRVLDAALVDAGYLPKEREGHGHPAPTTVGGEVMADSTPYTPELEQEASRRRGRGSPGPVRP